MSKIFIDRSFSFLIENIGTVEVRLSSHLFTKRVVGKLEEKNIRSNIFKSRDQYEMLLNDAFLNCGLSEYANHGRVAFIFSFDKQTYGILLDVKKLKSHYHVTVITIDRMSDRHYCKADFFYKESNKIYSDYTLSESFFNVIEKRVDRRGGIQIFSSYFFNIVAKKTGYCEDVDIERILSNLTQQINDEVLKKGSYWLEFPIKKRNNFFLRISIEEIKQGNENFMCLVLIDVKRSRLKVQERACLKNNPRF